MPCVCAAISDAIAVVNESSKLATVVFCTYDWRIVWLLFHGKSLTLDERERESKEIRGTKIVQSDANVHVVK